MSAKTKSFRVRLTIPDGATVADCRDYIKDAVRSWCGGYRPPGAMGPDDDGDPLFDLDKDSVRVMLLRSPPPLRKAKK